MKRTDKFFTFGRKVMEISFYNLSMKKIILLLIFLIFTQKGFCQTATYNINITVGSVAILTDATNDTSAGQNPTLNQSLTLDPDVGASDSSTSSSFRIRTNESTWTLSNTLDSTNYGSSMITNNEVSYTFTQTAGSQATAGTFVNPAPGPTSLTNIAGMSIATGSAKTSSSRGNPIGTNTNNYVEFGATTTLPKDFFYEVATPSVDLTYTLTAP